MSNEEKYDRFLYGLTDYDKQIWTVYIKSHKSKIQRRLSIDLAVGFKLERDI